MGMPEELIRKNIAAERRMIQQRAFEILPENWDALMVFLALSTQWRTAGMSGVRVGLEYASIPAVLEMTGFSGQAADIFEKLRIMEAAAIPVFIDKAKKEQSKPPRRHAR